MDLAELVIGKLYVYKDTECLELDKLPTQTQDSYVFVDPMLPQTHIRYLKKADVENFISEFGGTEFNLETDSGS